MKEIVDPSCFRHTCYAMIFALCLRPTMHLVLNHLAVVAVDKLMHSAKD
jgi:hypothetical protein